jgi:hypothetical protein
MVIAIIILSLAAVAAQPSPEAERLGRELASHGTLAAVLPMMKTQQVDELVAAHKDLSAEEQARLRKTADRIFELGRDRILTATGHAYAKALPLDDLKRIVAFYRTPAAGRFQSALPQVIGSTVASLGKMDFKADVLTAYCKETGKLCRK